MNESVDSDALVMPRSKGRPVAGRPPSRITAIVLLAEAELVHLLLEKERRVAHVLNLHPTHHLPHDALDVLVVDVHALQPVNLLNRVHQVRLRVLFTEDGENIVRVQRTVNQRFAGRNVFAFLHVDVHAARDRIFLDGLRDALAVFAFDVNLALALDDFAVFHHAVNFADDRGILRLARFEQFHDARQTSGDVLGLGRLARDLREHVAGLHLVAVHHHQVSA